MIWIYNFCFVWGIIIQFDECWACYLRFPYHQISWRSITNGTKGISITYPGIDIRHWHLVQRVWITGYVALTFWFDYDVIPSRRTGCLHQEVSSWKFDAREWLSCLRILEGWVNATVIIQCAILITLTVAIFHRWQLSTPGRDALTCIKVWATSSDVQYILVCKLISCMYNV